MARNKVEYHIPHHAFFTFAINTGETLVPGDLVKLTGNLTVGAASAAADNVLGVVYAGTVGKSEYKAADGDKVTVVVNKPLVYLTASAAVVVGAKLVASSKNKVVTAGEASGTPFAIALTAAAANNDVIIAALI